jgi:hypothetical protein
LSIVRKEEILFEEWSKGRSSFVKDGIINEIEYLNSKYKILYLLREVNSNDLNWDLREYIRSGARSKTWNNITRWTMGLKSLNKEIKWDELKEISEEHRKKELLSVAVVNVKKSAGYPHSESCDIKHYAKKNSVHLKRQIKIYEPDLIICCGTGYVFSEIINGTKWHSTSRGVEFTEWESGKFAIDWNHPQCHIDSNMLYYFLLDTVREIIKTS